MWFHMPVDIVDHMAFNVERSSQGHGGKSRGLGRAMRPPMPPLPGRPEGLPGMAGARDNLRQLVEQRTPSVVDDAGFNGADNDDVVGVRGCEASL
jgi:hypothetical protein